MENELRRIVFDIDWIALTTSDRKSFLKACTRLMQHVLFNSSMWEMLLKVPSQNSFKNQNRIFGDGSQAINGNLLGYEIEWIQTSPCKQVRGPFFALRLCFTTQPILLLSFASTTQPKRNNLYFSHSKGVFNGGFHQINEEDWGSKQGVLRKGSALICSKFFSAVIIKGRFKHEEQLW